VHVRSHQRYKSSKYLLKHFFPPSLALSFSSSPYCSTSLIHSSSCNPFENNKLVWIQNRAMESSATRSCCILRYHQSDLGLKQHGVDMTGTAAHDDQIVPDPSCWSPSSNSSVFTCFDSFLQMQVRTIHSSSHIDLYIAK